MAIHCLPLAPDWSVLFVNICGQNSVLLTFHLWVAEQLAASDGAVYLGLHPGCVSLLTSSPRSR